MIEIDTIILNDIVKNYQDVLKQIDENNALIFENFNDLEKHWKDERFINFKSSVLSEKKRIINLQDDISKQISIYSMLINEYKKLGRRIKCNLEKKDYLDNKLNGIVNIVSNIVNEYNDLGDTSYYNSSYIIENQKYEFNKILETLKILKNVINNKFDQVKKIESTVEDRLKSLSIENFALNYYEGVE